MNITNKDRKYAPATKRNQEPILEVLQRVLPPTGIVLEIASGTGEHSIFFAPRLLPRQWLPSDTNTECLASIAAWQTEFPSQNLYSPIHINAADSVWSVETNILQNAEDNLDFSVNPITAIVNINMIHISPWSTCLGLMAGASRILPPGGILYLYGPFKQNYQHTAPSNAAFDESLRSQNPAWGVRDLEEVIAAANIQQLHLLETILMPANNLSVIFQR